jgi:fatty-acyl-CoA synthase
MQPGADARPAFGAQPLSPLLFLDRSSAFYGDRPALRDGQHQFTYAELADHCARFAGALAAAGVGRGDRVAVLAPNSAMAVAATFAVPGAGGILVALNTRLSATELAYILDHAGVRLLIADAELGALAREALGRGSVKAELILDGPEGELGERIEAAETLRREVTGESDLISLNYTSGTTGKPKGVMYAHRGAYLQALAMVAHSGMAYDSVFLWTLPVFHCNGWCFPWAVTAAGATHHCLRRVDSAEIWAAIRSDGVSHLNAAPTVLADLAASPAAALGPAPRRVRIATGGAPPSPALLEAMGALNFDVTHLYGLTETYGPAVICQWRREWDELPAAERARLKARQGVPNVLASSMRVVDRDGRDVPRDGESRGEVLLRGNNVMAGYYRDPEATAAASHEGWFRTGDIGVLHPDGYLELRDRSKDVIISGGENIASIEVEQVLAGHPAVFECAVVGGADERWGEVPVAFVTLREGTTATGAELIAHCKERMARYKAPREVHFGPLAKTATGKVQKFVLREALGEGERRALEH